jgi:predicted alpha/beta-fold hydrolase
MQSMGYVPFVCVECNASLRCGFTEKENSRVSSFKTLWERIESIPFNPRKVPEPFGTVLFSLPDLPAYIAQSGCRKLYFLPGCAPFCYGYPRGFKRRIFCLESGLRMDSMVGEREGARSLFILVHGIFQSKNFKFIRDMAKRFFEEHSVVVVDTRDHLGTHHLSPGYPASGGFLEGEDILEIAMRLKREKPEVRIFLIGFSYGGGIVLNSLNSEDAKNVISGVIAVSPTMIIKNAVTHIDTYPGPGSPFLPVYNLFQTCLGLRHGVSIKTFHEYLEQSAKRYGYTVEEMMERSSLPGFIERIRVPALLFMAKDDPVIPEGDAEKIMEISRTSEFVHPKLMEKGGHIAFSFIDQNWFYGIITEFVKTLME